MDDLNYLLIHACMDGNIEEVCSLLDRGANSRGSQESGFSNAPLCWAVTRGHANVASLLLLRGCNADRGNPLTIASKLGHKELIRLLLSHRASPNGSGDKQGSADPLFWALKNGHYDAARLLIANGARADHGRPMGLAILQNDLQMAEFLTEYGARCDVEDLICASEKGYWEIVRMYFDKNFDDFIGTGDEDNNESDNDSDKNNRRAQIAAITNGHLFLAHYIDVREALKKEVSTFGKRKRGQVSE